MYYSIHFSSPEREQHEYFLQTRKIVLTCMSKSITIWKWSNGKVQLTVATGKLTCILNITGNVLFVLLKDFSQAERNRYDNMVAHLKRIVNPPNSETQGMSVLKSLQSFHISYRFPKCPGIQEITGKSL